jgi:predicted DCC family thiol-disulfide oxidoreductase YuxK
MTGWQPPGRQRTGADFNSHLPPINLNSMQTLTLFYDSYCPLCANEMDQLRRLDTHKRLRFADIHAVDFSQRYPDIDPQAADRILHARYDDGRMIYGLDVTHQAWALVGKQRWLAVLRWPVIRWFADLGYRFFARYRYGISLVLTGQRRCSPGGSCASATAASSSTGSDPASNSSSDKEAS